MPAGNQAQKWHVEPDLKPVDDPTASLGFHAVYDRWFDEVSRWVRAMGGPRSDSEDLAQEIFVIVHRRLHDFDGQNLAGWLYQIARHRVRDFRRLLWVRQTFFRSEPLSDRVVTLGASPADMAETYQKRDKLELLLNKLNESERAALVLFEIDGYSGEEIAHIQGVPINTVWARIHTARKKLRTFLAKLEHREQGG
jgi:RNA polymerase sigma-70 factor (ECF subfamily)